MRKSALAIIILSAACASRGGGGPGPGSNTNPDAPAGTVTSIHDIRTMQPTNGAAITLQNVVVVAHVSSSKYGHVWVQDQGGGQYSGIQLFCNYGGKTPNCAMTKAQIDALTVGTVVNVTGSFSSFLLSTAPAGAQPNLEIDAPMITPTGATMAPVAVAVDAATVATDQLAASGAEPYKGAYVKLNGSAFTTASIMAQEYSMTCTDKSMPAQMGTTFGGFDASTSGKTLSIGLNFYNTVTYCLPCAGVAMPYACTNPVTASMAFTSISGVVEPEYNSNGKVYLQISPTTDSDLPHS